MLAYRRNIFLDAFVKFGNSLEGELVHFTIDGNQIISDFGLRSTPKRYFLILSFHYEEIRFKKKEKE